MKEIIEKLRAFRDQRDWNQFHNPKDLAIALNIETSELLEQFLWKDHSNANVEKIEEELADVFTYAFLLADKYGFDVKNIVLKKMEINSKKYPVEKSKGVSTKYDKL